MTRFISLAAGGALLLGLLAGCTVPPGSSDAGDDGPIAAGRGRIYFYRTALSIGGPNSLLGDASRPALTLDGHKVAEVLPGAVFFCDMPPGRHEIAVAGPSPTTVDVQVAAGGTSYLRMDWGIPTLARRPLIEVDARTGRQETENRSRVTAACPA